MHASVRALLHGVIDYAGLFPPAKLPLEEALRTYLDAKKNSPFRWMLGRFVCPTNLLSDLVRLAQGNGDAHFLKVTGLGQQIAPAGEVLANLEANLHLVQDFRDDWGADSVIDMVELALPNEAAVDGLLPHLPRVEAALESAQLRGFFELAKTPRWPNDLAYLCHVLRRNLQPHIGLKTRCGGVTTAAFPGNADTALFIECCRVSQLPWKATAGLHHPCRHWDDTLKVWHHGFLNVFIAGVLSRVHALMASDVVQILADRSGEQFRFESDAIFWKNWTCTTEQITEARTVFATSFGSCSFDEPVQDLLAMGLLDAGA